MGCLTYRARPSREGRKARSRLTSPVSQTRTHRPRPMLYHSHTTHTESSPASGLTFRRTPVGSRLHTRVHAQRRELELSHAEGARPHTGESGKGILGPPLGRKVGTCASYRPVAFFLDVPRRGMPTRCTRDRTTLLTAGSFVWAWGGARRRVGGYVGAGGADEGG